MSKEQDGPRRECPILLADPEAVHAYCAEDNCAWWVDTGDGEGECAIVSIGRQIHYLQQRGPQ